MSVATVAILEHGLSLAELELLPIVFNRAGEPLHSLRRGYEFRWRLDGAPSFAECLAPNRNLEGPVFMSFASSHCLHVSASIRWGTFLRDLAQQVTWRGLFRQLAVLIKGGRGIYAPDDEGRISTGLDWFYEGLTFDEIESRCRQTFGAPAQSLAEIARDVPCPFDPSLIYSFHEGWFIETF